MSQIVLFDGPLAGQTHPLPAGVTVNDLSKRVHFYDDHFCHRHIYEVTEADGDFVCTFVRSDTMSAAESVAARLAETMGKNIKTILELVQASAETATLDECNVAAWGQAGLYVYASLLLQSINMPMTHADGLAQELQAAAQAWYRRQLQRN